MTSGQEGPPEETQQNLAEMAVPWHSEQRRFAVVSGGLDTPVDPRPRLKVLAVEDDREDFEITADLMARAEDTVFEVSWANDAETALQHLAEGSFDACLVDLRLPGMDGLGFADRTRNAGFTLPIILTSGVPEPETAFEAVERGFDDYVDKEELEVGQLERRIRFAVARRRRSRAVLTAARFNEPPISAGDLDALSSMLRESLDAKTLEIRYRPQEPLAHTDRVLSAELSLSGGMHDRLSIYQLVELSEVPELANALVDWVIETAATDLATWLQARVGHVRLSLPAAAMSSDDHAMGRLAEMLSRSGLPSDSLEVEFDEAQLADAASSTWRELESAKGCGFRVAVCGFGRSIASLSLLREVNFDSLKLAPEIVIGRKTEEMADLISTAMNGLCQRLDRRIVAENTAGFSNLDQLSQAGFSAVQLPTSITNQNAIAWVAACSERDPGWSTTERESISTG